MGQRMKNSNIPLLDVQGLSIGFQNEKGTVAITDEVTFSIEEGEAFALVGESGCGKSVSCLALLKLLPMPGGKILSGRVLFKGRDILSMRPEELRQLRGGEIGMIFQEPGAALNPLWPIRKQLLETFLYHPFSGDPVKKITELLERVGIADPKRILESYPHQLSGGMLQRVMIAMALSLTPKLLIADEPTTALDVTVQAQILKLLDELKTRMNMAMLFITHDFGVVADIADDVVVMFRGEIVETGTVEQVLNHPQHPYTKALLDCVPDAAGKKELKPMDYAWLKNEVAA